MTTVYEKIATSVPVNSAAARAVSQRGIHFEAKVTPHGRMWKVPQPLAPHPTNSPDFVDLTGLKYGRFIVVGYLGKLKSKGATYWLVRCSCGNYTARTRASIRDRKEDFPACDECCYVDKVKRGFGCSPFKGDAA